MRKSGWNRDRPTRTLPYGEANFNALYGSYKRKAIKRGLSFDLSKGEFKSLTKGICWYCGVEPAQIYQNAKTKTANGPYIYNGIDRVDSQRGYDALNCVSCCGICNKMKNNLDYDIFLSHIDKISGWIKL